MGMGLLITGTMLVISIVALLASLSLAIEQPLERLSPQDRIKENQIHIYSDKVVIDVEGASWATYADTNSMDPLFDKGTNGIELIPKSPEDLAIGDIAAYETSQGLIVHRIVAINQDSKGVYFTFKGDNNKNSDPFKVRFNQIKYVLIGIIY